MAANYVDIQSTGIALGQQTGGTQTRWSSIVSSSSNALQLQGSTAATPCALKNLADPTDARDAANKQWTEQAIQSRIYGLQLKESVELVSKTPVSLSGTPPANVRRWLGPWTTTQGGYIELQNLLTTPDYLGRTVTNTAYGTTFSYAAVATFTAAPNDGNMGGMGIGWSDPQNNAGNQNFNIGTGGWSWGIGGQVSFTPVANKDYGMLYTYDRATETNTFVVCEFDASGNPVQIGSPLTSTGRPVGMSNGSTPQNSTTLSRLLPFTISPLLRWKNVVIAPTIMTLAQALGPSTFLPPPPAWTVAPGIDGVVPTAGFRVLLTSQTDAKENGLYEVSASGASLVRPADYAVGTNAGANFVKVNGPGLVNDDQGWLCTTLPGSDVVGTHPTAWVIYTSANGKVGDLTLAGSQLTSASGQISLVNNSLVTTGSLAATSSALGTLSLQSGNITDSSGQISLSSTLGHHDRQRDSCAAPIRHHHTGGRFIGGFNRFAVPGINLCLHHRQRGGCALPGFVGSPPQEGH